MRIIPAIDLIEGKCVRLSQGNYSEKKIYNSDPLQVAMQFQEAGLTHLHLVDLDGAKAGKVVNWETIEMLTKYTQLHIDFGGGVTSEKDLDRLLSIGIDQINIGSMASKNKALVQQWIKSYGSDKIILSADVRDENIAIHGWQVDTQHSIYDFIDDYLNAGLIYVACTDIATDGMLSGPNRNLYEKIVLRFPTIRLIASGGVSSIEDVVSLRQLRLDGVIIGKAIYEKKIILNEFKQHNLC